MKRAHSFIHWLTNRNFKIYLTCLIVFILCFSMRIFHYNWNVTALLNIGEKWSHFEEFAPTLEKNMVVLTDSHGFDTFTFYYLIARDPFFQRDEWKSVKYQRIVYPFLSWLFSLGQTQFLPYGMILVQLLSSLWLCRELLLLLSSRNLDKSWALWGTLNAGMILSVLYLLTEPLSMAFVIWAYRLSLERHLLLSAAALALAFGTREATAVFWAAFLLHSLWHRKWGAVLIYTASAIPILAWNFFIGPLTETGRPPILSSSGSFGWPFMGFIERIQIAIQEQGISLLWHDGLLLPLIVIVVVSAVLAWKGWWAEKDLASLMVLAVSAQQILFLEPMWQGFFNVSRLILGLSLAFIFLPNSVRQGVPFRLVTYGGILCSFLALIRSCRLADELLNYTLTP